MNLSPPRIGRLRWHGGRPRPPFATVLREVRSIAIRSGSLRPLLGTASAAVLSGALAAPFDLDAPVPPGPPSEWARAIPVLTPVLPPIRTVATAAAPSPEARPETGVVRRQGTGALDGKLTAPASLAEVVTVDVVTHVPWTDPDQRTLTPLLPGTAIDARNAKVQANRLYWLGLVPLLRLWFHPEQVSRTETMAHLLELGEQALPALAAASAGGELAPVAAAVRQMIGAASGAAVKPIAGGTPYELMMFRFTAEELTRAFPYDPQGGFGRRLAWLGDDALPFVMAYTQNDAPFARRNATVALALFQNKSLADRWVSIAAGTTDPVVKVRALALLGRVGAGDAAVAPLCAMLEKERDEVVATRVARTLGELRQPAATASIVAFGKRFESSSDAVVAALSCLARIGARGVKDEALEWVRLTRQKIHHNRGRWRPTVSPPNQAIDAPDRELTRATVLECLATAAWVRMTPADPDAEKALFECLEATPGPVGRAARDLSIVAVPAVAQPEVLEALEALGTRGAEVLEAAVNEPRLDRSMRIFALRLLPASRRAVVARHWAGGGAPAAGLAAAALELLDASDDPQVVELATRVLTVNGFGIRRAAGTQARAALLIAVRALLARGALPMDRLQAFVESLDPAKPADVDHREQLKSKLQRLVDGVAVGISDASLRDRIAEIVSFVFERRQDFNLRAEWRAEAFEIASRAVEPLRGRKSEPSERGRVVKTLFDFFAPVLQYESPLLAQSAPDGIPLEETLLQAAARSQDATLLERLASYLAREDYAHAAFTCLALGQAKDKKAAKALLRCLADEDGFVRLCAYRSLRRLTGRDFFVDYVYGNALQWASAVNEYQKTLERPAGR